jgi:hypothetical protein
MAVFWVVAPCVMLAICPPPEGNGVFICVVKPKNHHNNQIAIKPQNLYNIRASYPTEMTVGTTKIEAKRAAND